MVTLWYQSDDEGHFGDPRCCGLAQVDVVL